MNKNISTILSTQFTILLTLFPYISQAQFTVFTLEEMNLPKEIQLEGEMQAAVKWADNQGSNIVVLSERIPTDHLNNAESNDGKDAALFASHYIVEQDSIIQQWRVYDFIKDCPVDIEVHFIQSAFQITDLNKDGTAEIWMMYKLACRGDVSPCTLKIIMYQGSQKFAMRGESKVDGGIDGKGNFQYIGGSYSFDSSFLDGPEVFRNFAKEVWEKNVLETWD